jgi:hypothetical protein
MFTSASAILLSRTGIKMNITEALEGLIYQKILKSKTVHPQGAEGLNCPAR